MTRDEIEEDLRTKGLRRAHPSEAGWYVAYVQTDAYGSGKMSFWVTERKEKP